MPKHFSDNCEQYTECFDLERLIKDNQQVKMFNDGMESALLKQAMNPGAPNLQIDQEAAKAVPTRRVGIEFFPSNIDLVLELYETGQIDHVQITVPSPWDSKKLSALPTDLPICIHSTLLNVTSLNNWSDLKLFAKTIRKLKPTAITDHFGSFVDSRSSKHAVFFRNKECDDLLIRNADQSLSQWSELVELPIHLENLPIRDDGKYLELFQKLVSLPNVEPAIDLAHLVISMSGKVGAKDRIIEYLARIRPTQVHISALKLTASSIEDNHYSVSSWLFSLMVEAALIPRFVTIEQSERIRSSYLKHALKELVHPNKPYKAIPDLSLPRRAQSEEQFSLELALRRARSMGLSEAIRSPAKIFTIKNSRQLQLTERYYPYLYPFASLSSTASRTQLDDALTSVGQLLSVSQGLSSWADSKANETFFVSISNRKKESTWVDFQSLKLLPKRPNRSKLAFYAYTASGEEINIYSRKEVSVSKKTKLLSKLKSGKKRGTDTGGV